MISVSCGEMDRLSAAGTTRGLVGEGEAAPNVMTAPSTMCFGGFAFGEIVIPNASEGSRLKEITHSSAGNSPGSCMKVCLRPNVVGSGSW